MNGYITTYKGKKLYAITYKDFVRKYEHNELNWNEHGYIIEDKRNALIVDNMVVGHLFDHYKKIARADIIAEWTKVYEYKREIISERPTIESQVKEAEVMLNKASKEASASLEQVEESGVNALEKAVTEGESKITEVTSVKPPVKRTSNRKKRVEV